jgi:hypothetical protein
MFKIYKRTIHIGQPGHSDRLEISSATRVSGNSGISKWLTVPAMLAGAVVGTLMFSALLVAILIPLSILGIRAWLRYGKLKGRSGSDQVIDAQYTVITESDKTPEKAE